MRRYLQLGWVIVLGASCIHAAEIANLRNGFSIRHEHHEMQGQTTRLYLGDDASSGYVDVATAEIESFEPAPEEAKDSATSVTTDLASIRQRRVVDTDTSTWRIVSVPLVAPSGGILRWGRGQRCVVRCRWFDGPGGGPPCSSD